MLSCVVESGSSFFKTNCDKTQLSQLIVLTWAEYNGLEQPAQPQTPQTPQTTQLPQVAQTNPFYMTTESALAIGGAMLLCMSVAWVLRMARISLGGSRDPESE